MFSVICLYFKGMIFLFHIILMKKIDKISLGKQESGLLF